MIPRYSDMARRLSSYLLAVGCDIVETNTFGANRIVLGEYGLEDQVYQLNIKAVQIARRAVEADKKSGHPHTRAVPQSPFWGSRVIEEIPLPAALAYLNETMLFQIQWHFRRRGHSAKEFKKYLNREARYFSVR